MKSPLEATAVEPQDSVNPEEELAMADSVGLALLVVLERLAPAERIAFVLHDMFDLPFEQIGPIVGRTPTAARQLASRARRRVRGGDRLPDATLSENRRVVDAFLAASREGDFETLLSVLDPDVVVKADPGAVTLGAQAQMRGAQTVAEFFRGRAQGARTALIDGAVGAVVAPRGKIFLALRFAIAGDRITTIEVISDPERLASLELALPD